jgi:DNA-binding transcriptional regulator LsrR (DeoR family)
LAKSLSQDPEIFLPPISEVSGLVDPYEDALKEADILLLSGGARSKDSFIGQFLDFHEKTTPEGAIGDLVGHPILADGQDACDAQCREVLNVLRCRPTLDDLEKWSRDRNKHVILLADAIPWRDDDNLPTKARLVLAVLRRGLANQLIISKHLADEVVLLVK